MFFGGDYRVLRGGSFGTDASAIRATFRNWDHPIRRQIFSGFRCARDADRRPDTWPVRRAADVCRHLAYLGPPTTLAALLFDPPHGLLHQSYAPADMRGGGTVNADGFGVGWYPRDRPRRRATAAPPDLGGHRVRRARRGHHRPRCSPRCDRPPRACPSPRRRPRRSARGAGCSATTGWSAAGRAPRRGSPPSCPSRTCSRSTRRRTPRCCGRWSATACGPATTPRPSSRASCAPSPPRPPGPG